MLLSFIHCPITEYFQPLKRIEEKGKISNLLLAVSKSQQRMNLASQSCHTSLKAALNTFKSQCLKVSTSLASIYNQTAQNTAPTKYRSYRQMKILEKQREIINSRPSYKEVSTFPLQNQGLSLVVPKQVQPYLPTSKLKRQISSKQRIKTQPNQKQNQPTNPSKNRQTLMNVHFLQNNNFVNRAKEISLDLTVKNMKIGPHPRQIRHTTGKQLPIPSQQRPYSAIQQATRKYSAAKNDQSEEQFKKQLTQDQSAFAQQFKKYAAQYESPQISIKQRPHRKTADAGQNNKVLSAWQIQKEEESFFQQYRVSQKKKKRVKRRNVSKPKKKS